MTPAERLILRALRRELAVGGPAPTVRTANRLGIAPEQVAAAWRKHGSSGLKHA